MNGKFNNPNASHKFMCMMVHGACDHSVLNSISTGSSRTYLCPGKFHFSFQSSASSRMSEHMEGGVGATHYIKEALFILELSFN